MPTSNVYGDFDQTRTNIPAPNAWTDVTIPQGAKDTNLSVEGGATAFRMSSNDSLNPATQGTFVPAGGSISFEGTTTQPITIYVSAVAAPVVALLQYEEAA